mmetsp:Transcript_35611/g.113806  ORF Transcript_35611/g.113806 Transcript_35611/m.113806 type:complete len:123 (-) Transcript_35611:62-430(-)
MVEGRRRRTTRTVRSASASGRSARRSLSSTTCTPTATWTPTACMAAAELGAQVLNGTKWSANFWVWNVKQNYKSSSTASSMAAALEKWEEHRDRLEEEVVSELAAGRLSGYTPTGVAGHKEL